MEILEHFMCILLEFFKKKKQKLFAVLEYYNNTVYLQYYHNMQYNTSINNFNVSIMSVDT